MRSRVWVQFRAEPLGVDRLVAFFRRDVRLRAAVLRWAVDGAAGDVDLAPAFGGRCRDGGDDLALEDDALGARPVRPGLSL
jgi:hypothetical protein